MTSALESPEIRLRSEGGLELAARVWYLRDPMLAISSAPLGGGLGLRQWVLNVQVAHAYDGAEPGSHLEALAAEAGAQGLGVGMMTAVDVRVASTVQGEGIAVDATVGVIGAALWAAAPGPSSRLPGAAVAPAPGTIKPGTIKPGTINIVVALPERLSDAALVNAIGTATEAKTQALWDAGVDGTGTATDALCLLCPPRGDAHAYGGPRSLWGARLARVVYHAVRVGCAPVEPS
jgi:adenosylcobinamide amidohydrolase